MCENGNNSQRIQATVVAQVPPITLTTIAVHYKSGDSKAAGLEPKTSGADGKVSWTGHVGGRTTLGSWPVIVSASGQSEDTSSEVVH